MTIEQLIAEGRSLQRPSIFLRPQGDGPIAAIWHERDNDEIDTTGYHRWITVGMRHIPGMESASGCISILTDEEKCCGGRVEYYDSLTEFDGTKLYAHPAAVLPPIDAVFARGSNLIGAWIESLGWNREWRYNSNFKGRKIVEEYERIWMSEFPVFSESDVHAILGGWHGPGADDDWHALIDEKLMVLTVRDSEPWVEAWRTSLNEYRVIQRIT